LKVPRKCRLLPLIKVLLRKAETLESEEDNASGSVFVTSRRENGAGTSVLAIAVLILMSGVELNFVSTDLILILDGLHVKYSAQLGI
jgi:hypothetical protein